jgi:ceroid-lipofuscinosis MFS transporter 7
MSSFPDPATDYVAAEAGGDTGATMEMNRLDQGQNQNHHHHQHYQKMASELPQDRFVDEVPGHEGEGGDDEDDDELQSMAQSITSSVLTADGIHDVAGFNIVCMVILIGDMSRGVFFPSLWPLVSELGGSTVTLGYAVAAFSFGRILVSPLFGSWSVTFGYTKTLLFSCSVLLCGTFLYAQAQNVGSPEYLIFAQTVLGVGSGTLGVTRAYIAEITAQRHRTTYMAWITAVQYAGFTVTPFVGAIFNKTLQDVDIHWG